VCRGKGLEGKLPLLSFGCFFYVVIFFWLKIHLVQKGGGEGGCVVSMHCHCFLFCYNGAL
jgi:hypothetical protein